MRSTTELRDDILSAAEAEFARYGLAGARIDRIAKEANASKERLYAHFGDKESLFREVVLANGIALFSRLELRPDDVPGFVGKIFDLARERPDHMRMMGWARLEGLMLDPPPSEALEMFADLRSAISDAQAQGFVDKRWDPQELVVMLFGVGMSWAHWPDHAFDTSDEAVIARRRADTVEAARRLITPAVS